MKEVRKEYKNYGTFKVTAACKCEKRMTMIDLGIHTGYIDEIAFALTNECFHSLNFKLVNPSTTLDLTPKENKVRISLDFDCGAYGLNYPDAMNYFREFFSDRDVQIIDSHGFCSCTISTQKETVKEKELRIMYEALNSKPI